MQLLLEVEPRPVIELDVKVQHFVANASVFEHSTIYDHTFAENGSTVILPWLDRDAFGFDSV